MTNSDQLVQIITAPENLYIQLEDGDGDIYTQQALCLGLTAQGEIKVMSINKFGEVREAQTIHNYLGVDWRDR